MGKDRLMIYERPTINDVPAVVAIARKKKNLDRNSSYLYALHCLHFRDTSLVAKKDGKVVGFVIGYRIPKSPQIQFIWQYGLEQPFDSQDNVVELVSHMLRLEADKGLAGLDVSLDLAHHDALRLFTVIAMRFSLITQVEAFDGDEVMIHLESREAKTARRSQCVGTN